MDESSLLETTAEISVAFAGFIGIFLALAARDGRFPPAESFQIRLIVICSIAPVFLGVLPLLLDLLGWPWEPSGGLYLVSVWSIVGVAAGNFVELLFRKLL